ncbi:MAG: two-component system sensor histidine kinase NtrB [Candidatus Rokuibacteriota bacterium]
MVLNERIVSGLGLGLLACDRQGRVLAANGALTEALGLSGDPVGADVRDALAEHPALADLVPRVLATSVARSDEVPVTVGGRTRRLLAHAGPLPADASPAAVALAVLDVTALREAADARRRASAFTGLARYASHLAHEVKNPLGALKLYALLLQRQVQRETEAGGLPERIARAVDQLSAVVGDIASPPAAAPLERQTVSAATVLDDALARMADRLKGAAIEVVRQDGASAAVVSADPLALRRVVAALVQNAIDAMPGGGTLTIGVAAAGPREVALSLHDSGPGIPEDVQARLFEPFVTTRASGMGLGLALARQVVDQHGGRVEVNSRTGAGTTVRIVLPVGT